MKVLIVLLLGLVLAGCSAEIEPVTIDGFSFQVGVSYEIGQGEYDLSDLELESLLPGFTAIIPEQEFKFALELIEAVTENDLDIHSFETQVVDTYGVGSFGDISFADAGQYTFRVSQLETGLQNWQLDESVHYLDVKVTYNDLDNLLVAVVTTAEIRFNNVYVYDVSLEITEAFEARLVAMQEDMTAIEDAFLVLGGTTSFYFVNLDTGFRHGFNETATFFGASTPKVFYAHYLYLQDELGYIELRPIERLWLQYKLRTSLDEFSLNLERNYGLAGYHQWLDEQEISVLHAVANHHYGISTNLSAVEAAVLMESIYEYFLTESPNALEFREHMINNEAPFIVSDRYNVASKTGWLFPHAIRHDVAIVEAPSPYVLVVLSQNAQTATDTTNAFARISNLFAEFNDRWFVRW